MLSKTILTWHKDIVSLIKSIQNDDRYNLYTSYNCLNEWLIKWMNQQTDEQTNGQKNELMKKI